MVITDRMNLLDLTPSQLMRAAAIKEHIEKLTQELRGIFGGAVNLAVPSTKKRTMSTAVKRKIAAAQKARWANQRRTESANRSVPPAAKAKKKMSPATRAKLAAKLKAYWAAKRAGKK